MKNSSVILQRRSKPNVESKTSIQFLTDTEKDINFFWKSYVYVNVTYSEYLDISPASGGGPGGRGRGGHKGPKGFGGAQGKAPNGPTYHTIRYDFKPASSSASSSGYLRSTQNFCAMQK